MDHPAGWDSRREKNYNILMKIIAFNGSPRKGGNTEQLLDAAIRGTGVKVTPYRLNAMDFKPCQNCGGCDETGECILKDELAPLYEEIRSADRIILASPVYFMSVSAQVKSLVDRMQSFWCAKYLLNNPVAPGPLGKKGLVLLVGALEKEAGIKCASSCSAAFMRTVGVPEHTTLKYTGVDAKGAIAEHPSALKEAQGAGRALIKQTA